MSEPLSSFTRHYHGRHSPEDALWWLDHPESTGPSGAPAPQQIFLAAADELQALGMDAAATTLLEVLADLLQSDRRAALDALRAAQHQ